MAMFLLQSIMSKNALTSSFSRAAAKVLLGVTLLLATGSDTYAQEQPRRSAPADTTRRATNTDTLTVVTWGDSIGNGIGNSLTGSFNRVVNLGRDGSGLTIDNKPRPLDNLPRGAVVLMSIGTNDVGTFMTAPEATIDSYARRVMVLARQARDQGATPVIIGMQAPTGAYTGNPKLWNTPGFVEAWTATMTRVNAAIERAARQTGIAYSTVQGRVNERDPDHLHYTSRGSRHIAQNALRDAGIRR